MNMEERDDCQEENKEEKKEKDELGEDDKKKFELFEGIKNKIKTDNIKEFNFKEGKVYSLNNNITYQITGRGSLYFFDHSKIIYFTNEKKGVINQAYFIHNYESLKNALEKTDTKDGILKTKNDKSKEKQNCDSNQSEISKNSASSDSSINSFSVEDILKSSYNLIEAPKELKIKKILTNERFIRRFELGKISDLDFNFKYIKEDYMKNEIYYFDEQDEWCKQLEESIYFNNTKSYCYIFGPEGVGKTTFLLKFLNLKTIPRMYFSLKIMSEIRKENKKWKKYSLLETTYILNDLEHINEINIQDISNSINPLEFIKEYIKYIVDLKVKKKINITNKKVWVIIDDYDQKLYDNGQTKIIDEIIKYVTENKDKLYLCVLGTGEYMNKKLYEFYMNRTSDFVGIYWNRSIKDELTNGKELLKIPKYYYEYKGINNLENVNIDVNNKISSKFQNINLVSLLFLDKYLNKEINIKDFELEFPNMPLEYLSIHKYWREERNGYLKFSFNSEIYEKIFEDTIKGMLKIEVLKNKMIVFKDTNGKNGIDFEDLIVEQLWNNTLDFILFPKKNRLEVAEIYDLKNKSEELYKNLDYNSPIIIRQTKFKGKYYDLLLILKINNKNYAIFVQIGLNKIGDDINTYLNNLKDNIEKYKDGIKELINQDIDEIGFLLIFEYKHQMALSHTNYQSQGFRFCDNNNLDYLIYKDFNLYKRLDDQQPIKSIQVTAISNDKKNVYSGIEKFRDSLFRIFEDNALLQNSNPTLSLKKNEEKIILDYLPKISNEKYLNLQFSTTLNKKKKKIRWFWRN